MTSRRALLIVLALLCAACGALAPPVRPVAWEHGWKTPHVVATRYRNDQVGFNIGFTFPRNPADCDREELSAFVAAHGGWIMQSGGYPGAEMFVRFTGVNDRGAADRKLAEILPDLERVVGAF